MPKETVIRATRSVCPVCLKQIGAEVIEHNGAVYLDKKCGQHGAFSLLISRDPSYYRELNEFYFSLITRPFPQKDYLVHLSDRCNLNCPICLADANGKKNSEYSLADLSVFLKNKKNYKIDLMGAEPTVRDDLPEIIRMVKDSGNIAALHTNGLRLADREYLAKLKASGLAEVHLQFDGLDDNVNMKIRGRELLAVKMKALDNLETLNVSTDLVMTVVRGVNEREMVRVMDYGLKHENIKEVFFLGCRYLGKAKDSPIEQCVMPDELIDMLEEQTGGKISRGGIRRFQKLYFSLLAVFSKKKCFYIHHYLLARGGDGGYATAEEILDLPGIEKGLERFRRMRLSGNLFALPYLFFVLMKKSLTLKALPFIKEAVTYVLPFLSGFNISRLSRKTVLIGFITACDAYSFDLQIAQNCGKGAVSADRGTEDLGAVDNVLRDRGMKAFL